MHIIFDPTVITAIAINAPKSCELRCVISFLQAEGSSADEIHHQMFVVFGEYFMIDSAVRKWLRKSWKVKQMFMTKVFKAESWLLQQIWLTELTN